jgi:hypothetical protein
MLHIDKIQSFLDKKIIMIGFFEVMQLFLEHLISNFSLNMQLFDLVILYFPFELLGLILMILSSNATLLH